MRKQIRVEARDVQAGDIIPGWAELPAREVGRVNISAIDKSRIIILDTRGEQITRCYLDSEINVNREVAE
jgi:hypothetical protein